MFFAFAAVDALQSRQDASRASRFFEPLLKLSATLARLVREYEMRSFGENSIFVRIINPRLRAIGSAAVHTARRGPRPSRKQVSSFLAGT